MLHYVACGLSNVWLVNGFTEKTVDGKSYFSVENPKELHKAIGFDLAKKHTTLDGDEIRFLRTEMALSRKTLAEYFGCSPEAVKKWESGENPIQKPSDALLRSLFVEFHNEKSSVKETLEVINQLEKDAVELRFAEDKQGKWGKAA